MSHNQLVARVLYGLASAGGGVALVALDNHRASDVIGSWLLSEVILTVVALLATARDGWRRPATARDGPRRLATARDGSRRLATPVGYRCGSGGAVVHVAPCRTSYGEVEAGEHQQHWPRGGRGRWIYRAAPSSAFTTAAPDSSTPTASTRHPALD